MSVIAQNGSQAQAPAKPPVPTIVRIDSQYNRYLRARYYGLLKRFAFYAGLVSAVSTSLISHNWWTTPTAFLLGATLVPLSCGPAIAARKSWLTNPPNLPPKTTLFSLILSPLLTVSTLWLLATYAMIAVAFTTVYCQIIQYGNSSLDLGLTAPTTRHPHHLNERFLYLLWGNVSVFLGVGLLDIYKGRLYAVWPKKKVPLFVAARSALKEHLLAASETSATGEVCFTFLVVGVYTFSWIVLRKRLAYYAIVSTFNLAKPFLINIARGSRGNLSITMPLHLIYLAFTTLSVSRLPAAVLNAYVTSPLSFDSLIPASTLTSDRYILTALQTQNAHHLRFTTMEMLRVAHEPARRKAIFADVSNYASSPVLTHVLWQELLLVLGRTNHRLSTRAGRSSASGPAPAARPVQDARSITVKQGDIFRPVQKKKSSYGLSLLQNAVDGPIRAAPPQPVLKIEEAAGKAQIKAIEGAKGVQQSIVARIEGIEGAGEVIGKAKGSWQSWRDSTYAWEGGEWARRNVDLYIPNREIASWIIDIFATLVVASADEDMYGHVQQVLPATMEAIVKFRTALLSLESELLYTSGALGAGAEPARREVKWLLRPLINDCNSGLLRIVERFGKSLGAFRFPPAIANTLEQICRESDKP